MCVYQGGLKRTSLVLLPYYRYQHYYHIQIKQCAMKISKLKKTKFVRFSTTFLVTLFLIYMYPKITTYQSFSLQHITRKKIQKEIINLLPTKASQDNDTYEGKGKF